jgi:hypothetical protein
MEDIKIIDRFLSDNELNQCINIVNNKEWYYGHTSGNSEKFNNQFFAAYDLGDFFTEYIKTKLESVFNKKFQLDRNYMHIQYYGQCGSYHIDTPLPNTYTFCIYLTDISDSDMEDADGDFLLKIPNTKDIVCINTIMNRGVFFPSIYFHKGMAYNRFFPQKRLCITWKMTELFE